MKILVVDDELVSRKKMSKIMGNYGKCDEVGNGKMAIKTFQSALLNYKPYDLITLDISMPDMDGTEVLRIIRQIEEEHNVPEDKKIKVLMVTSHAEKDVVVSCVRKGCDDYIIKPFKKYLIYEALSNLGFDDAIDLM